MLFTYLHHNESITSLEALKEFGCLRLAARIADLRNDGHNIVTENYRTSTGKMVAKYKLSK